VSDYLQFADIVGMWIPVLALCLLASAASSWPYSLAGWPNVNPLPRQIGPYPDRPLLKSYAIIRRRFVPNFKGRQDTLKDVDLNDFRGIKSGSSGRPMMETTRMTVIHL